jgi:hypothetical protein
VDEDVDDGGADGDDVDGGGVAGLHGRRSGHLRDPTGPSDHGARHRRLPAAPCSVSQ